MAQQINRIPASPQTPAPIKVSLDDVSSDVLADPFRMCLYGVPGVGKSSFAMGAPKPVFLDAERGTTKLRVKRYFVDTWPRFMAWLDALRTDRHDYQTVVIDTVDALEKMLWLWMCATSGHKGIEDYGFGKGFTYALEHWREAVYKIERLRLERGMNVIFLGHATIKGFNDPEGEGYDRYQMLLNDKAASLLKGWCETVLFANYETWVKKEKKRPIGQSSGARLIHTERTAAYDAKNRDNLPPILPLDWEEYEVAVARNAISPAARLRAEIEELLTNASEELREKCRATVASNPDDERFLARVINRLNANITIQEKAA